MKTKWREGVSQGGGVAAVADRLGFAPVSDVRRTLTPQLAEVDAALVLIDLGEGKNRLGGSCLAQVYGQVGDEAPDAPAAEMLKSILRCDSATQSREESCSRITIAAMADCLSRCWRWPSPEMSDWRSRLPTAGLAELFSEELGAVVQVATRDLDAVVALLKASGLTTQVVGQGIPGNEIVIRSGTEIVYQQHSHGATEDVGGDQLSHSEPAR